MAVDFRQLAEQLIDEWGHDPELLLEGAFQLDNKYYALEDVAQLGLHFWPRIEEGLGLDNQAIQMLYRARKEKRNKERSKTAFIEAMIKASDLIQNDRLGEAQSTVLAGYKRANNILLDKAGKPVRTVKEDWADHLLRLERWKGQELIGFKTDMVQLTENLLGLRGLILLAAPPNVGKTILALQLVLQALKHHPEACCVFLSLDMHADELVTRAACNLTETNWKSFVLEGDMDKWQGAAKAMENLWERLIIVDRDTFNESEDHVLSLAEELREATGCTRTMLVVDYLQVWDVPESIGAAFKSDLEGDRWRIEAMKRMKNTLQRDDAILCISEIRKQPTTAQERFTLNDVMGSARLAYAADTVLIWQELTQKDKCMHMHSNGLSLGVHNPPLNIDEFKQPEIAKKAKEVDDYLRTVNTKINWLDIAKARDGTKRGAIPITAYYDRLAIEEGMLGHGLVRSNKQEETLYERYADPFATVHMDEREVSGLVDTGTREGDE